MTYVIVSQAILNNFRQHIAVVNSHHKVSALIQILRRQPRPVSNHAPPVDAIAHEHHHVRVAVIRPL